MKTNEIRTTFLNYFKQQQHQIVASSPLIPANDPSLLFTNAGMVQFKDVFLGNEQRPYTRACSSQCCVRAGGKHNDLENVGYTARHHTFFEMLGNFSFGDYFKREAIQFAWNFLTQHLKLPAERLWITVFRDDDEAADIWLKEIKIDATRFSRCDEHDNFWSMGDTGPCGPCTEIFYDHGESIAGGPPGSETADGDRYVEIWNLVFMQFNRDASGKLTPLPKPSVDTGMGLERIAAVMQGVHSNYDIDIFRELQNAIINILDCQESQSPSLRVIADHIRSASFLITDGVMPSNEGRGYVLRRIIRRAIRHGHKLGARQPFFSRLVEPLTHIMGDAYPQLVKKSKVIEQVLAQEEQQFNKTLQQGLQILEDELQRLSTNTIAGDVIFKLYDTYGMPVDITQDIAKERDLQLDMVGFEHAMRQQREQSREASMFVASSSNVLPEVAATDFCGYQALTQNAKVLAILVDGQTVNSVQAGQTAAIILNVTPFYGEGGGQVGDHGELHHQQMQFRVHDTTKHNALHLHHGEVQQGSIKVGDEVTAVVDHTLRMATMLNHSATHLLHAALRQLLGEHVTQKGSLVNAMRLRFDFSHFSPVTASQIAELERLVNEKIRENLTGVIQVMTPEAASQAGAIALFGEKYGEQVRVLSFGEFSKELCGGTHVTHTGQIGFFKIIQETGIASGVRRIEALTGKQAVDYVLQSEAIVQQSSQLLKTNRDHVVEKLQQQQQSLKLLEKQLQTLQSKLAANESDALLTKVVSVDGFSVLATCLAAGDIKTLRDTVDHLKNKLPQAVIVLANVQEDKVNLVAGVSKTASQTIHAGELVSSLSQQLGGRGGGRPDLAQGGGNNTGALTAVLASVVPWVKTALATRN